MAWNEPQTAEQERRWASSPLAKSMLLLHGSERGAQAMAKLSHGAERRYWMALATNYTLRARWVSSVQSSGTGGPTGPTEPTVLVESSDTIAIAFSETGAVSQATPISSSDTITLALSESGNVLLPVQTDPAVDLKPSYPAATAGDFLFAHVTVHAEQSISVDGSADGWSQVGSVILGDLGNVVLSKTAAGQIGTAFINWHGENLASGGAVPSIVGAGAGVTGSDPATNLAVPYPAVTIEPNDLLVLVVAIRAIPSTTATASGFTQVVVDKVTGGSQFILTRFATGGESGTVSVDWHATSSVDTIGRLFVVRGVISTNFVEGSAFGSGSGSSIAIPSVTTLGPNRLVLAFAMLAGAPRTFSPATGETGGDYTEPFSEYSSTPIVNIGITTGVNAAEMPNAGTISGGTIASSGSNAWQCRALALIPLATGGGESGARVAGSVIYSHAIDPGETIKSVTTTQGTGGTATFPSVTLGTGDTGLAFLSVNGAGLAATDPSSTWTFVASVNTTEGDDAAWGFYDAATSPTNGTLAITAGDRWSVVAVVVGPSGAAVQKASSDTVALAISESADVTTPSAGPGFTQDFTLGFNS